MQDKIICAPNAPIIEKEFLVGKKLVGKKYPDDVPYNACQIGKYVIGSKYTDKMINPNILVKQGYTKCSICVTSENSCITSDNGIDKILKENGINSTLIEENNIKLLKRDRTNSNMKGFIGGASFVFDNKFVLFGDIENLESKEKITKHLKKYKLELVNFKGLQVNDYGGAITI